ncbi:hypothetical protein BLNAU_10568 [Blattamonas nauphoetae]|uniref:Uncharacterized protein n=1 Tax=Blattamonas nauphoetae TaxID=2049346 RepID=A0ABQ9XQ74_9EUKA|nr:hypothetical protein BLNAU_10568 [Blattamonas nauphoetae]
MSEDEPDDSNCMSKCRLYNMPICITEAKAKELKQKARDDKKRMKARFNNLRKEEESILSAVKEELSALEKEEK